MRPALMIPPRPDNSPDRETESEYFTRLSRTAARDARRARRHDLAARIFRRR